MKCLNLSVIVLLQYPQEGAVHTMLKASLTNYLYDGEGWGEWGGLFESTRCDHLDLQMGIGGLRKILLKIYTLLIYLYGTVRWLPYAVF